VVRFRLGPITAHLICHPDHVEHVLRNPHGYDKNTRASRMIRLVTGDGLLVSNGAAWQQQRCAMQPTFTPQRAASYLDVILDATQQMLREWRPIAARGEPIDIASQMMRLTFRIVERALFSTRTSDGIDVVEDAITVALEHAYGRVGSAFNLPLWAPTPGNLRFRRAMRAIDRRVYQIIDEHRASDRYDDLLSSLMRPDEPAAGRPVDAQWLRNQTITLLLAGHETTANAMTWLWYLLAEHPDAQQRVHDQAASVIAAAGPTHDELQRLTEADMAVCEAMRLYTPIWAIARRAAADDAVGGYRIPKGSRIVISPYITHRHPAFWESPDTFDPQRFSPQLSAGRHPYAYIPFGAGARYCIGRHLAKLEALVITAMVARAYRIRLAPDQRIEPAPGITLRARHGVKVLLEAREPVR
jgi:cytochrome P450